LRVHDIGHIDELVLPREERNDLSRVVGEQIRDDAALHRGDDLLALRGERHDLQVDRVAASLLVIGDDLFDRHILFLREALRPPHLRGRGRRIGDIGAR
jgi:hypothetical protein